MESPEPCYLRFKRGETDLALGVDSGSYGFLILDGNIRTLSSPIFQSFPTMSTIATASIEAFLLENYIDQLEDIAEHGCSGGTISELIYHYQIDEFYQEHKDQIDAIAEEVFYESFVGYPEEWFKNAKRLGFDIVNLDDARRFYTYLAVEVKAQELQENF